MKRMLYAAVLMAIVAGIFPAALQAQPHPGRRGALLGDRPTSPVLSMLEKRLELTAEQKGKVEQILNEARQGLKGPMQEARAVMQKTREGIEAVLTPEQKEKFKRLRGDILAPIGRFGQGRGPEGCRRPFMHPGMGAQMPGAAEEMRMRMALRSLELTPEQRAKLEEVQKGMRQKREELQKEMRPKLEQLRKDAQQQVQALLSEEQRQQLQKRLQEMPTPGRRGFGGHGECPAKKGDKPAETPKPAEPTTL